MLDFFIGLAHAYAAWWLATLRESPLHVIAETTLLCLIVFILLKRRSSPKEGVVLTDREVEELVDEWQPEPLVPAAPGETPIDFTVRGFAPDDSRRLTVILEGLCSPERRAVSFCSMDFLGLGSNATVRNVATSVLDEYTLGSCGPRGFYGTTRKHLELESRLASFAKTPDAISYSDATATVASAIPAFAKRGDVLIVDEGCSYGVMVGARLSRARIVLFRHNDTADLARHLVAVGAADAAFSSTQRRFVVVEGLYADSGDLAPLSDIVNLARQHRWRIIVDDSCGFAVLGRTGRGSIEHCGLAPEDVDVLVGSLSTTFASVGGFCVGSREVVDHQRLSGAGYCFSASAPPFLCATAVAAISEVDQRGEPQLRVLRDRAAALHRALLTEVSQLKVISAPHSPVQHLLLPVRGSMSQSGAVTAARDILRRCAEAGFLLSRSHAVPPITRTPTTIRVCVTAAHSVAEVDAMVAVLAAAVRAVLGSVLSS